MRLTFLVGIIGLITSGCGVMVPAKYEVTDVSSGKTFTTYATWGKENMLGYNFYDIGTGERVMLKSYQTKKISDAAFYPNNSPEAYEYLDDEKRIIKAGN